MNRTEQTASLLSEWLKQADPRAWTHERTTEQHLQHLALSRSQPPDAGAPHIVAVASARKAQSRATS